VTYIELVNALQAYTENVFPDTYLADGSAYTYTQQLNTFITQAETRIYNTVLLPALRKNVTGSITSGNKYLSCPSDFLSVFSISLTDSDGNQQYLLDKDVSYMRAAYPSANDTGTPKYYALFGPTVTNNVPTTELSFIVAPTPDTSYPVEMHYYYYPESITTADSGTTWLGDNYSPVLLYGALVEAYIFMKGEQDMMAFYEKKFQDALAQTVRMGAGLEQGDTYRDGQAKMKVNP
jgi:hypothetical protein